MERISVNAFAKINLSIDVTGKREDGYHQVEMVMQQIDLFDSITIGWEETKNRTGSAFAESGEAEPLQDVVLTCNLPYLPLREDNIAFRAARLMIRECEMEGRGIVTIHLDKRIPVAAGLAGGSANGAAVLHGLNRLWGSHLSLNRLLELGSLLGADVPFCVMGQAALNPQLGISMGKKPASSCALACGIGTELTPLPSLKGWVLLAKPPISVSTAEVYRNLCMERIPDRPDNEKLVSAIRSQNWYLASVQMKNVLEQVTLEQYPQVKELMDMVKTQCKPFQTRMSGSGPTVFGLFLNRSKAQSAFRKLRSRYKDTFLVRLL